MINCFVAYISLESWWNVIMTQLEHPHNKLLSPQNKMTLTRSFCVICWRGGPLSWWQPVPKTCPAPPGLCAWRWCRACIAPRPRDSSAADRRSPPLSTPARRISPLPRWKTCPWTPAWWHRRRSCHVCPWSAGFVLWAPLPERWWDTTAGHPKTFSVKATGTKSSFVCSF